MADLNIFPLYTDAYLADTTHLSRENHGSYLLLLMAMWRAGGSLPHDVKLLSRIAKASPKQWAAAWREIGQFFTIDGEKITQKRLSAEYEKACERKERSAINGTRGGRPKSLDNNRSNTNLGFETETQREPGCEPKPNPEKSSPFSVLRSPNPNERSLDREALDRVSDAVHRAAAGNVVNGAMGIENLQPILDLEAMGCDLDLDICPAIAAKVPQMSEPLRTWGARFLRDAALRNLSIRQRGRGAPKPEAIDWDLACSTFKQSGIWLGGIGPEPGYDGCRCPPEILKRYGIGPQAA